jgi:hypothetical protein
MNGGGRLRGETTPEGRLAAVASCLAVSMADEHVRSAAGPAAPDYADYREALRPYILRELLLARIDEARKSISLHLTGRVKELAAELAEIESGLPAEHRL